ncbi:MAG: type II toxin-antitoxin system mRNA interferase toxin, RelE/StbE family [Alphaproteobacteria bacterium CG11_big_fil_rev_8_21_14_0_20_39_49]|nr:MAG: type II toxin-antitoxin system mRNA interferase toxin, RelE/StbE family [Alphaproteobacteria bacterium CG11_big_fil_rev_8_21_14_0_20_39_49]
MKKTLKSQRKEVKTLKNYGTLLINYSTKRNSRQKETLGKKKLSAKNKPHKLSGNWYPHFECHIEPDWLLIYLITDESLILVRTGTHSDLFR